VNRLESRTDTLLLDRRRFLAATAAWAALGLTPQQALALASPARFKQGAFEVTVVSDGHLVFPIKVLAPDAPPDALKALLVAAGVTGDEVQPPVNPTLIKAGSDLILFDTGSGTELQPTAGKLHENLKLAGIDPAAITKVVFTHAHPDHIWGTVNGSNGLNFPNAAYYCGAAEWDFWMGKDILNQMPKDMHGMVLNIQKHLTGAKDRITMLKGGSEIVSGIRMLETFGHTPGHASFEVDGDGGLVIVADAVPPPFIWFPHPEWRMGFDAIPEMAIATRKQLLNRAADERLKMIGFHWPYPGVGYAERKDDAFAFVVA
jgi:glyoxylase-like metal-dependent hydrolase (beta-lactamase superfamily II)